MIVSEQRRPLGASAVCLMVLLCLVWGFGQVAAKIAAPGVSLVMQAAIRSTLAATLLLLWTRWRGIRLFERDRTLVPGLVAGGLFAVEFLFIYLGLGHTDAARMIVAVNLAPCFTVLGLHFLVSGERLHLAQWLGVALALLGMLLAFGQGFLEAPGKLLGDAMGVLAALLWAATTVLIRATRLANVSASKTLFYQLAVSAVLLFPASLALGETGVMSLTPLVLLGLAYQAAIVAFASYLTWFWLLTRYLASRLATFTFLAPLFGVAAGALVLGEPVTLFYVACVLLVGIGIYLVNSPRPS